MATEVYITTFFDPYAKRIVWEYTVVEDGEQIENRKSYVSHTSAVKAAFLDLDEEGRQGFFGEYYLQDGDSLDYLDEPDVAEMVETDESESD